MATRSSYEELARHLTAVAAVRRELARRMPPDCPPASAAVLMLLKLHGEVRASQLSELLAIDMSVTSRHVAHSAGRGWVERRPDPNDGRSRLLRLTEAGRAQLATLSAVHTETLQSYLHDWSDTEVAQLNTMLERLRRSFDVRPTADPPRTTPAREDSARSRPRRSAT